MNIFGYFTFLNNKKTNLPSILEKLHLYFKETFATVFLEQTIWQWMCNQITDSLVSEVCHWPWSTLRYLGWSLMPVTAALTWCPWNPTDTDFTPFKTPCIWHYLSIDSSSSFVWPDKNILVKLFTQTMVIRLQHTSLCINTHYVLWQKKNKPKTTKNKKAL